jgi:hypothetical protein
VRNTRSGRSTNALAAVTPAEGQRVSVKSVFDDGRVYQVRLKMLRENTQQAHSRAWFVPFSGIDHRVRSEAGGRQTGLGHHHRLW